MSLPSLLRRHLQPLDIIRKHMQPFLATLAAPRLLATRKQPRLLAFYAFRCDATPMVATFAGRRALVEVEVTDRVGDDEGGIAAITFARLAEGRRFRGAFDVARNG